MSKISTVNFKGKSGSSYAFDVFPMGHSFREVGIVYVVTRRFRRQGENKHRHKIIYVGETGDASTRFDDHHKATCFTENNANCVCTHIEEDEDARLSIEADLNDLHDPPCKG